MGQSKGRGGDICRTSKPEREILGVRRGGGRRRGGGETRERGRNWNTMENNGGNRLQFTARLQACELLNSGSYHEFWRLGNRASGWNRHVSRRLFLVASEWDCAAAKWLLCARVLNARATRVFPRSIQPTNRRVLRQVARTKSVIVFCISFEERTNQLLLLFGKPVGEPANKEEKEN